MRLSTRAAGLASGLVPAFRPRGGVPPPRPGRLRTPRLRGRALISKWAILLLVGLLAHVGLLWAQTNDTIYFLVDNPLPSVGFTNESYVLPVRKPEDVALARAWVQWLAGDRTNSGPGPGLVVAQIAASPDGINRDYLAEGFPAWSWHVTEFRAFANSTWEVMDGSPRQVEEGPEPFVDWGIGFWSWHVTRELGPVPLYLAVEEQAGQLRFYWSGVGTNVTYTLQSTGSPVSTNWITEATGLLPAKTNQCTLPRPAGPPRYYRVRAEPLLR